MWDGGDSLKDIIEKAVTDERERCVKIVRRICGETRHVTLGDQIERAIENRSETA